MNDRVHRLSKAFLSATREPEKHLDQLVDDRLLVELKAVDSLAPIHSAQVLSYMKMTGIKLGLLINFKESLLKSGIRRIILS